MRPLIQKLRQMWFKLESLYQWEFQNNVFRMTSTAFSDSKNSEKKVLIQLNLFFFVILKTTDSSPKDPLNILIRKYYLENLLYIGGCVLTTFLLFFWNRQEDPNLMAIGLIGLSVTIISTRLVWMNILYVRRLKLMKNPKNT